MLKHIQVVPLRVRDMEAALAFYTEKVGFEVGADVTMEGGFRWVTIKLPGTNSPEVFLMQVGPDEPIPECRGGFMLHTDDCQAAYEALKARGVEFAEPPAPQAWGLQAAFPDPDGNMHMVIQPMVGE